MVRERTDFTPCSCGFGESSTLAAVASWHGAPRPGVNQHRRPPGAAIEFSEAQRWRSRCQFTMCVSAQPPSAPINSRCAVPPAKSPITSHPECEDGETFCCAGCVAGGPCICISDATANDAQGGAVGTAFGDAGWPIDVRVMKHLLARIERMAGDPPDRDDSDHLRRLETLRGYCGAVSVTFDPEVAAIGRRVTIRARMNGRSRSGWRCQAMKTPPPTRSRSRRQRADRWPVLGSAMSSIWRRKDVGVGRSCCAWPDRRMTPTTLDRDRTRVCWPGHGAALSHPIWQPGVGGARPHRHAMFGERARGSFRGRGSEHRARTSR